MHKLSGVLNVYFPFELKSRNDLNQISRLYNKQRDRQIKLTRHLQRPRTDLMDSETMRSEVENILSMGQKLMGGTCESNCEPYATYNISKAYHKEREENLFIEETSVIISEFSIICPGVNKENAPMKGCLFYFNNIGNHVGTYILSIRFKDLLLDEAIRLKHVFYKRAQVHISDNIIYDNPIQSWMTFQEYVCNKAIVQCHRRKTDIDSRARYTFMEIEPCDLDNKELNGLLESNEKYRFLKGKGKHLVDYSRESSYSLYYDLRSALLVNKDNYNDTIVSQRYFFDQLLFNTDLISIERPKRDEWVAGLEKGKFPYYLKSVELHFLTNNAMRHETVRHDVSYSNPYVFIRRRHKIGKILYELDISHCFINDAMLENFGVKSNIKDLKEEYSQLTSHLVNYLMILVTAIAAITAIV